MSEIKIDNSIKNAITKGNWKDPGAKLYDDILKNTNWKDLLKEAYLVAPVNDIINDPRVRTRLNSSGCKYPHHHIKDGKLVVSISGLRSAYICARNQGYFNNDSNNRPEYSRSVVTHLNRHCKELGIEPIWHHGELYFQDIKSKKFVEYTDINEFNEDSDEKLYRVTHNGIGIYEAMRQHMSLDKWRDFLKSDNATWLPKPDKYPDGYTSYFTKEGIDKFNELVYPIACGVLGDNIKYEEFDQDDIGNIVYKDNYQIIAEYKEFNEASHGKLKYDFRKGYDWNSGHGIKIIYSLDNIEITNIGKGFSTDADKDKNIKDIEKNIKNKGNMDHASHGQKVLAIIDRVTGERLNECDYIGPFAPAISNRNLDLSDDIDDLHDYYNSKGPDFVKRYINHIKVGEIDNTSVYKSTHWFKNDMKEVKDRYGYMDKVDNTIIRGTKAEALKYGRGAKMNDIDNNDALGMVGSFPKYNHPSKKDKKRNPEYYENEEFTEKSHSNLKYAFRMAVNPHNGHFIKIVFDLDSDKVLQIGDHTQQSGRNKEKDEETRKNIRKNGSNDFSSIGLVKGIQDLDTKEQLKSVDTLGVIGASNQTRFSVPEELRDKRLGDEQYNMFSYPVKDREKIIKTLNLDNAKDIIKFTVGEVEKVPSYKATLLSKSISGVYHNQFNPKGRGDQSKSKSYDQSIYAGLKSLKSRYKKVHDVLKDNDYYEDDFDYIEKLLNKLEEDVDKHSDEKYGQSTMHPRYSRRYSNIDSSISELEVEIKNMKKKKDSKVDKQINENFNIMYTIIQEQTGANLFDDNFEIFEESDKIDIVKEINYCMDMLNKTGDEKWLNKFKLAQKKLINESYAESSDIKKNDEFVPIFGILKKTSLDDKRNDGSEKDEYDKEMSKFQKQISTLTFGDNYAHALISFDDKFNHLYSFGDEGIEDDSIYLDSWMATDSIYICVMFVTKDERDKMKIYVDDILAHPEKTSYAFSNLLKAYISKPAKIDKRFVCSTFTGFIMSCANPKNLNKDYSRLRPEDITILPRAFYVMNIKDREEFINRRSELINRVKAIYDEYHEELEDYNNHLPKLLLKDRVDKLKTSDKILDWIISKL